MMKRLIIVYVIILCAISMAGYAEDDLSHPISSPYYQSNKSVNPYTGEIWSTVVSHRGNVITEFLTPANCVVPELVYIDGDILCLREGSGNAFWYTFFDVEKERISKTFENVIGLHGDSVLYTDYIGTSWQIVMANAFTGEVLRTAPMDLHTATGQVEEAVWEEENGSWLVSYLAGENFEEQTIVFPAVPDVDKALFPIRENGLWGYMNQAGEVVIEPQWAHAWPFDGNTALVSTREIPAYVEPHGDGIIGKDGNYVVTPAPEQTINEDTYAYRIRNADDGEGFYDKASGFYQPPLPEYSMVMLWSEDGQGPIAVERTDGLTGYVNRATGETVIPFIYTGESDDVCFCGGYARPADHIILVDTEGETVGEGEFFYLIDSEGSEITLPDNMNLISFPHDGFVIYEKKLGDFIPEGNENEQYWVIRRGERYPDPWQETWGTGLAKLDGTMITEPDPAILVMNPPDESGMVTFLVETEEGRQLCGHMDTTGNVIVPPAYYIEKDWWCTYQFVNGYAVIADSVTERWVVLDTQGYEIFSHPMVTEDGKDFSLDDYVLDDGLLWYQLDGNWGLFVIADELARRLTGADFEDRFGGVITNEEYTDSQDFAEGLQQVKQNGLWGYINRFAQWVIEPRYDNASSFHDGLALVEKDGKLLYIDHEGNVVWQEK